MVLPTAQRKNTIEAAVEARGCWRFLSISSMPLPLSTRTFSRRVLELEESPSQRFHAIGSGLGPCGRAMWRIRSEAFAGNSPLVVIQAPL